MPTVIVAKAIVTDGTHVLLIRRHPNDPHRPGQWDIPGGAVDADERFERAAARELKEEAGVAMAPSKLQLAHASTRLEENTGRNLVRFDFLARVPTQPKVTLSAEHTEWRWLSFDEAIVISEHPRQRQTLTFVRDHLIKAKMPTTPVAKALLLDDAGNALLLTRSATHPTLPLQPDMPGGELEADELPARALAREITEETGLQVTPNGARLLFAEAEVQDNTNFVRMLFAVRVPGEKPKIQLSWEHSGYNWVVPSDIPNLEEKFNFFVKHALTHIRHNNLLETA